MPSVIRSVPSTPSRQFQLERRRPRPAHPTGPDDNGSTFVNSDREMP
jgi:hypothetical protein